MAQHPATLVHGVARQHFLGRLVTSPRGEVSARLDRATDAITTCQGSALADVVGSRVHQTGSRAIHDVGKLRTGGVGATASPANASHDFSCRSWRSTSNICKNAARVKQTRESCLQGDAAMRAGSGAGSALDGIFRPAERPGRERGRVRCHSKTATPSPVRGTEPDRTRGGDAMGYTALGAGAVVRVGSAVGGGMGIDGVKHTPCPSAGGRADGNGKVGFLVTRGSLAVACFGSAAAHEGGVWRHEPVGKVYQASERQQQQRQHYHYQQQGQQPSGRSLSALLPYAVLATAVAALSCPPTFLWFGKEYYAPALGGIMLSIGVQLSVDDFVTIFKKPFPLLLGLVIQYVVKPLLGLAVAITFRVPPAFAAGLLLTTCVSGAQLSSYATSLGKGQVALSVVLTSLSTFLSVVATPFLSKLLIGAVVPVDAVAMAKSIVQVVILPVALGLILNATARPLVDIARPWLPLLAMVCMSLCIGSPLAHNQPLLATWTGLALLVPVLAFHIGSFSIGYWLPKLVALLPLWKGGAVSHASASAPTKSQGRSKNRIDREMLVAEQEAVARTLSLTAGMQSSTLAILLASQFLGSSHAVPASCSVVVMSLLGLGLGAFWGRGQRLRDVFQPFVQQLRLQRHEQRQQQQPALNLQ